MVIGSIYLGLGNQMFEYAAARAVSLRLSTKLFLHLKYFKNDNGDKDFREFGLKRFKIQAAEASTLQVLPLSDSVQKLRATIFGSASPGYFKENTPKYMPSVRNLKGDVRMVGLFHNELYFSDVADQIRAEFQLVEPLPPDFEAIRQQMIATPSVSLHVRRGDYAYANAFNYMLSPEYYNEAVEHIRASIPGAVFYVFSDEPDWVVENLPIGDAVIVSGRGAKDYEELALMGSCKNHIIANSTFSWWGAWLNPDPNKIVIAPKNWYSEQKAAEAPDIIPPAWIKM